MCGPPFLGVVVELRMPKERAGVLFGFHTEQRVDEMVDVPWYQVSTLVAWPVPNLRLKTSDIDQVYRSSSMNMLDLGIFFHHQEYVLSVKGATGASPSNIKGKCNLFGNILGIFNDVIAGFIDV